MKNITRVLALLLALILVLGLVVTGFADDSGTTGTGKITIDNAVVGQTYTIYKILTLESYNAEPGKEAYSYKAASGWENFFKTGDGATYFDVTADGNADNVEAGYVTWKSIAGETEVEKQARVAEFAKKALAYAKNTSNSISATRTQENVTEGTVTFDNLPLGYYLLDSSLGTLCSLDTTNSEVNIQEKNKAPTNTKQVQEDSKVSDANGGWGDTNDADIGQTVNFKSTITAQPGAQNYVFEDTMSNGLTYNNDAKIYTNEGMTTELHNEGNVAYTVNNTPTGGPTFTITFTKDYLDGIKAETTLYVKYSAVLNENAVIGTNGNTNKSVLKYGDATNTKTTPDSTTTTKTWEVKVFKFHQKDENTQVALTGATFTLNTTNQAGSEIKLINKSNNVYRVAKPTGENAFEENAITEITTDTTGKFTIQGLDSDTYYLTEKEAPKGYNKLNKPIKITIDNEGNVKLGENGETTVPNGEVKVENKTGAEMPSTGGIGTTVFYVVGGILAVGAAVLLVTKKRMERG